MAPRCIGFVRRDPIGPFDQADLLEPTNIVRLWTLRILVASTNLLDSLDQAAFRRFDLKLKFSYLDEGRAWTFFLRQCSQFGFGPVKDGLRHRLKQLKCLTPGDFAAVSRRHRFNRITSPAEMLKALEGECALKAEQGRKTVGF